MTPAGEKVNGADPLAASQAKYLANLLALFQTGHWQFGNDPASSLKIAPNACFSVSEIPSVNGTATSSSSQSASKGMGNKGYLVAQVHKECIQTDDSITDRGLAGVGRPHHFTSQVDADPGRDGVTSRDQILVAPQDLR